MYQICCLFAYLLNLKRDIATYRAAVKISLTIKIVSKGMATMRSQALK